MQQTAFQALCNLAPLDTSLLFTGHGHTVQKSGCVQQSTQHRSNDPNTPGIADHPPNLVLRDISRNAKTTRRDVEKTAILTDSELALSTQDIVAISSSAGATDCRCSVVCRHRLATPRGGPPQIHDDVSGQTAAGPSELLQYVRQILQLGLRC